MVGRLSMVAAVIDGINYKHVLNIYIVFSAYLTCLTVMERQAVQEYI